MSKSITSSQLLGEIGEAAVRLRFLNIGFQFDVRSRLEAGIDGIAEVMDKGKPLARMIAVQVKATESVRYSAEDDTGFNYLLRQADLEYWRGSNLPIIIVLYRRSDETYFWTQVCVEKRAKIVGCNSTSDPTFSTVTLLINSPLSQYRKLVLDIMSPR